MIWKKGDTHPTKVIPAGVAIALAILGLLWAFDAKAQDQDKVRFDTPPPAASTLNDVRQGIWAASRERYYSEEAEAIELEGVEVEAVQRLCTASLDMDRFVGDYRQCARAHALAAWNAEVEAAEGWIDACAAEWAARVSMPVVRMSADGTEWSTRVMFPPARVREWQGYWSWMLCACVRKAASSTSSLPDCRGSGCLPGSRMARRGRQSERRLSEQARWHSDMGSTICGVQPSAGGTSSPKRLPPSRKASGGKSRR